MLHVGSLPLATGETYTVHKLYSLFGAFVTRIEVYVVFRVINIYRFLFGKYIRLEMSSEVEVER